MQISMFITTMDAASTMRIIFVVPISSPAKLYLLLFFLPSKNHLSSDKRDSSNQKRGKRTITVDQKMMKKKHLSAFANNLFGRCSEFLGTSVDELVREFELSSQPEMEDYARKLVEFCSSRTLNNLCQHIEDKISDGSLGRLTFDMMVAWEIPKSRDEQSKNESIMEIAGKEKEDLKNMEGQVNDDIPLFYSDIMPLLVDEEHGVGVDAFVWLGSLLPLVADVVNAQFAFEALAAHTGNRLYFPAYDRFLKEIATCLKYLQKQSPPTGVELAADEFILHVEGTPKTQRVIRHIGTTSWPGRLTLTNQALYFENSGLLSYENALKIDLSKPDNDHQVKAASTGPWGAPLFDKAMVYQSSQLPEPVIFEFPEMSSSTRRDHWLTITKEIILLHQFLSKDDGFSLLKAWELQSRTILGIVRLHAAREMLRIAPPDPRNFLIFTLFEELPKGDYVLKELSNNLKQLNEAHPCSAASVLKDFNMPHPAQQTKEGYEVQSTMQPSNIESIGTTISQAREEAKESSKAKATMEGIKEEGLAYSLLVLMELLSPLKNISSSFMGVVRWEKTALTLLVLAATSVVIYKEWAGYAMAVFLLLVAGIMIWARHEKIGEKRAEIVVSTASDQTTMESIVAAHHGMKNLHSMVQTASIAILKIESILVSRAPKHADFVMVMLIGGAILFAIVPFKFVILSLVLYLFMANRRTNTSFGLTNHGERRLKEWWNSIPVTPVRIVDGET